MRHFVRFCCMRFVAAEPEKILSRLSEAGIEIADMEWIAPLTVEVSVRYTLCARSQDLRDRYGISWCVKEKQGVLWR